MHYPIWYLEITIVYTTITQIQKYNQNQLQAIQKKLRRTGKTIHLSAQVKNLSIQPINSSNHFLFIKIINLNHL